MAQSVFTKPDSSRCGAQAMADSLLCFPQAPEVEEERHRSHVKGGRPSCRPKGGSELSQLKQRLREDAEGVLEGTIAARKGVVAVQALSAYRGVVETELYVPRSDASLRSAYLNFSSVLISNGGGDSLRGCIIILRGNAHRRSLCGGFSLCFVKMCCSADALTCSWEHPLHP
jgi:hypothetical protein